MVHLDFASCLWVIQPQVTLTLKLTRPVELGVAPHLLLSGCFRTPPKDQREKLNKKP